MKELKMKGKWKMKNEKKEKNKHYLPCAEEYEENGTYVLMVDKKIVASVRMIYEERGKYISITGQYDVNLRESAARMWLAEKMNIMKVSFKKFVKLGKDK